MFDSDFIVNPLPVIVIAEMLGIPGEDQRDFQIWSNDLDDFFGNSTATIEVARRAQKSLISLREYFCALLPKRRANKADDLVSLLLRVEEEDGEVLTEEELLAQCTLLLVAGHETTRNLLGNGLLALLQNQDQYVKLIENRSLMPLAVREFGRYDSPVQFSGRAVTEDFSWQINISGKWIEQTSVVLIPRRKSGNLAVHSVRSAIVGCTFVARRAGT